MSTAQLQPEEQAIVRRSLVDRLNAKTKLIDFFNLNARAKHGVPLGVEESQPVLIEKTVEKIVEKEVPKTDKIIVEHKHEGARPEIEVRPRTGNSTENSSTNGSGTSSNTRNNNGLVKNIAIIAALLTAGGAGTALIMQGFKYESPVIVPENREKMSPLQYLEDQGEHLP